MKTLYQIIIATLLLNTLIINAQVSASIYYHDNRDIETNFYGFHMSNFFEQCICYDPDSPGTPDPDIDQCMEFAASLKPKVVRFPAGGDHKFMHLLDDDGYGYREQDIDEFVNQGWLTTEAAAPFYSYINSKQEVDFNDIRFIDRFINFLEFCEDENGFKPQVIFVANILLTKLDTLYTEDSTFREIEHENMEVMRYLMDHKVEIVGIEMGNEHYDDRDKYGDAIFNSGDEKPNFNIYFQTCKYLLDSLDSDPDFSSIPVALLAAPEPIHGAATGIGSTKIGYYEEWNEKLKIKATSPSTSYLFDAYTVHIYNRPDDLPECYRLYYDDYVKTNPTDPISTIDDQIIPAWECAQDSFRNYTTKTLQTILNNYAGTCTSCLGNDKPYWITEWGLFGVDNNSPEVNYGYSTVLNDTVAGNFGDTFIDAAYAFHIY
ncbi:MAG: hypothetical protein KA954_14210 [Chitinophagales bacterium]|nr:hypothetical protein [Bacteroidota bacterium]MBP7400741.1 hypothetical protein [Chitinophagales bacterium]MBK8488579.1 hypothetical protein [Bacteroidota bacterium]MBK8681661.1 hypothetical protein [Bacteroidota bacterium]MBP8754977.1 hypothetical protein [Chitinophagales bacterium]